MFALPVAAGEAVAVVGVAPWGTVGAGTEPVADADGEGEGEVAARAAPLEWVILGSRSQ